MKDFVGKLFIGFCDWIKMEFMKGDINEFMGILFGYKLMILIGLGIIILYVMWQNVIKNRIN